MSNDQTTNPSRPIDPRSGFCPHTKTFHPLRPRVPLPPLSQPLSLTQHTLSLLRSQSSAPAPNTTVLIDAASGRHLSYSHFLAQIHSLTSSLAATSSLSRGHVAFILVPSSLHVPVLYFALLALGDSESSSRQPTHSAPTPRSLTRSNSVTRSSPSPRQLLRTSFRLSPSALSSSTRRSSFQCSMGIVLPRIQSTESK
jgi:hypothetical protein